MQKLLLFLFVGILLACNSKLPGDDDEDFMTFATYKVPVESGYDYWYAVEKNGQWFYIISDVELTSGSQITTWDHASSQPREFTAPGTIQLPNDDIRITDMPLELRWELGY